MSHHRVLSPAIEESAAAALSDRTDRRRECRVPFPAELLLVWHHNLDTAVRYRILDASDGGLRIHSSLPLSEKMTGMALQMLPWGETIDQTVCVAWTRPSNGPSAGYEIGLRYF